MSPTEHKSAPPPSPSSRPAVHDKPKGPTPEQRAAATAELAGLEVVKPGAKKAEPPKPAPPLTPRQLVDLWHGRASDQHTPSEQRTMYSLCAQALKQSLAAHGG